MSSVKHEANKMEANVRDRAANAADAAKGFGNDVKQAAQEQFEHLRDSAQDYIQEGRKFADEGRRMAGEYMDEGRKRAVELEHTIESQIRRQPLKSLLAASAAGFLLGMLFVRK
ncbi:MAG: hypothetical protein K8U03_14075 [Planctomycetia bacterium]|nr:hypothetical protein [Planctomycetia bacterium]